jgi:hypothetical protein
MMREMPNSGCRNGFVRYIPVPINVFNMMGFVSYFSSAALLGAFHQISSHSTIRGPVEN